MCLRAAWIASQVKKTQEILNNTIDTSIIELMEPPIHHDANEKHFVFNNWLDQYKTTQNTFTKGWNALKFIVARKLIHVANSDSLDMRLRAVKHLAEIGNLEDWQYAILAHMCNAKTAVGLARTAGVDGRFFMEPQLKYSEMSHYMLVQTLEDFLIYLNNRSNHRCLAKFISRVFGGEHVSCL